MLSSAPLAVIPYLNVSVLYRLIGCNVEPEKGNSIVSLFYVLFCFVSVVSSMS